MLFFAINMINPMDVMSGKNKSKNDTILVKISHYDPSLGGVNCLNFKDGECLSKMASGLDWKDYYNVAIACPPELELGTKIIIEGNEWTCLDRGEAIVKEGNVYWVDMLSKEPPYPFGTIMEAEAVYP